MRRRSIITVGSGDEEIKIYTIRRKDGYPCFQCAWYALGHVAVETGERRRGLEMREQCVVENVVEHGYSFGSATSTSIGYCG